MKRSDLCILVLLLCAFSICFAQNPEWMNYTNGENINTLASQGNKIWVGTLGGLVEIDITSGNQVFYNSGNSGIQHNHISCLAVGENGDVWMGSLGEYTGFDAYYSYGNGISCYDGLNWTVYDTSNSELKSNSITALGVDRSGHVWAGLRGHEFKLHYFNGSQWVYYDTSYFDLATAEVTCLLCDENDDVWIGTEETGLAKFNGTDCIIYNTSNSDIPSDSISSLCIDSSGTIWVGTQNGLASLNNENWQTYNPGFTSNKISDIDIDLNGNVWVGVCSSSDYDNENGGLACYNGSSWSTYDTSNTDLQPNEPFNHLSVTALTVDDRGQVWFACGGLKVLDKSIIQEVSTSQSVLLGNIVDNIHVDHQNRIWCTTRSWTSYACNSCYTYLVCNNLGVIMYDGMDWTIINSENAPSFNYEGVASERLGKIWFCKGTGLISYDGASWNVYDALNTSIFNETRLRSIMVDDSNQKWIGTNNGLIVYDDQDWVKYDTTNSDLPSVDIGPLAVDKNSIKWIGTSEGLVSYDNGNWTIYNMSNTPFSGNNIDLISVDSSGAIWVSTGNQLNVYNGVSWTVFTYTDIGFNTWNCRFSAMGVDPDGRVWIGRRGWSSWGGPDGEGLACYDGESWIRINHSNSDLPDDHVLSIDFDTLGNMWVGTRFGGLAVYNRKGVILTAHEISEHVPYMFSLFQNYPNPFNPTTAISYQLSADSEVELTIYDIAGRKIKTLINEYQSSGYHTVNWDASGFSSGIYFYRLVAQDLVETKKMVLMK